MFFEEDFQYIKNVKINLFLVLATNLKHCSRFCKFNNVLVLWN